MKKLKKVISSIFITIVSILALGSLSGVSAASAGPMYLGIVSLRSSGYGYKQTGYKVWKIAEYDSETDKTADLNKTIYCIKGGPGFGSSDLATGGVPTISEYSQKFNLKDLSTISDPYKEILPTGGNYNSLMWLLDNIYVMPKVGTDNTQAREAFLKSKITDEYFYELVTDDDIDVAQQLAIWYFTNPEESDKYHYGTTNFTVNSIANVDDNYVAIADLPEYAGLDDEPNGWDREDAIEALFQYYITNAKANSDYVSQNNTTTPIEIVKSNAIMQKIGNNYVAGPYKINQLLDVDYTLIATYTDTDGNTITPTLGVKDSSGNIVETSQTMKELVGTEFYLIMPTSSNISGINMTVNSSYASRTAEYWSVENAPATEQPVVIVDDTPHDFSENVSIVVPKPFDLSLRKFITEVNGKAITNREPTVDTSKLASGEATTAIYEHSKVPVKVAIGDTVTYTIRVYNEGEVDGYVEEITDHLPDQLEFIVDDQTNIDYGWKIASSTDLKTIKTTYLSKANETTEGSNKIAAFNGTTLAYKDVKIKCKVVSTNPMPNKITNIADITKFTDGDGNTVTDRDSQENNVILPTGTDLENYKDPEINRGEEYIPGQQDDDDFEKLTLKSFDLALRKFITKVNDTDITNRIPQVNVSPLNNNGTTAIYKHPKTPISVAIGDIVEYTIRVYNEAEIDGYVEEIIDHLPDQLEFLPDNETNKTYKWTVDNTNSKIIRTTYLSKLNESSEGSNKIVAFDGTTVSYKEVKVACKVVSTNPMPTKITNIADISKFTDGNGNTVTDRDSQENNVQIPEDLPSYKDDEISKDYVPGQQDDDDFEKLKIKEFDLALRKFITKVNDTEIKSRIPQVDVTGLKNGTSTTAIYSHSKEPVEASVGAIVEYTIRVYNEGQIDGYAEEITDHLPDQLEFLPENETNKKYGWTIDSENSKVIRTTYLSEANEESMGENKIAAFDGTILSYKEVKVVCKVVSTNPMPTKITNIADVSDFTDSQGNNVKDRDSEKENVEIPEDLPGYKDSEIGKDYVPGQEDDDDFEKILIAKFDLALRKFITAVNTTPITSRVPQVDVSGLIDGTSTTATYTHSKEPVLVSNGNVVTYTIRVYNEGNVAGYAQEVKDDIPEGLKFLPNNDTNQEYRWVMLDKEGNETENEEEAVSIVTDYLSKEQEKTSGENLIKAFNKNTGTISYKDVKVAFEVAEPNTSDRIVINKAQISDDADKDGNDVEDEDSDPDEWNEGEDDQDIEKIKVQYFDLSLRKWVTQAIVTENGEDKIIETGHKAEDDPEDVVKVDLKKSKINKVTVKFRYKIRVKNEGTIAGYAKELKDYIPEGLKFVAEDNPLWTQIDEKTITTDQTKDILLAPGDTTEVEVILTWINDSENFGVMDNWAEISKDYNDFNSPDIDSTPDNNKHGEDDIDDAPVLLSVQTGQIVVYGTITMAALAILASGIALIKKFVL